MHKNRAVTPKQAQESAKEIRELWKAGKESQRVLHQLEAKDPDALRYRRKEETFGAEAKRLSTNIDKASKMRRVAEEYTTADIDAICGLVRRYHSRFAPTHLLVLLRVENRDRRDRLMRKAILASWTSSQLERAVQAERGQRRPYVGRKPFVPADAAERLLTLDALAEKWIRWCDAACPHLTKDLCELLAAATTAMHQIKQAVEAELQHLDAEPRRAKKGS
jgi:hypothetical protein